MIHLFALLPAKNEIRAKRTATCQRLIREWDMYVIKSKSLRKCFISIKGIYYQAEVMGEKITWLVPHKFSQELPTDVDYKVMLTFLDFYEVLMGFVLYRLYASLGLKYPPTIDAAKDEQGSWMYSVKTEEEKTVCILVATSGDTGKGALEGFRDVDRTRILVFYPKDGVSAIQELQMVTQEGKNVGVCSVFGNFDDAQTGVKKLFSDEALRQELARRGYFLSSANSINWGRVLPQIVYYISAYCDLLRDEKIQPDQAVNVCVPTGNFGNILAAYYAREMGVPIDRLICASNSNNVLTDFIRTGRYDRNRAFHNTISPSMDILISSNLERLLLALTQDDEQVKDYMAQLSATGTYQVSDRVREKLQKRFAGYFCDDAETKAVIGRIYQKYDYLIDPHTAVAFDALEQYRSETGDQTPCIVVSTASPFKFCDSVLSALGEEEKQNGLELLDELSEKTGMPAPKPLASLRDKEIRFTQTVEKDHMVDAVLGMLE